MCLKQGLPNPFLIEPFRKMPFSEKGLSKIRKQLRGDLRNTKPDSPIDRSSQVAGRRTACFALAFVTVSGGVFGGWNCESQCARHHGSKCAPVVEGVSLMPFVTIITVCHVSCLEHRHASPTHPAQLAVCVALQTQIDCCVFC